MPPTNGWTNLSSASRPMRRRVKSARLSSINGAVTSESMPRFHFVESPGGRLLMASRDFEYLLPGLPVKPEPGFNHHLALSSHLTLLAGRTIPSAIAACPRPKTKAT